MNEKVKTGLLFALFLVILLAINSGFIWGALFLIASILAFFEANKLFNANSKIIFLILALVLSFLTDLPVMSMIFAIIAYASYIAYHQEDLKDLLPLVYAGLGLSFIYELYIEYNLAGFIWLLLSVVLCDSFAYFIGKKYGKTPFCKTSPNKTIEGVAGGVLVGGFASSVYAIFAFSEISYLEIFLISFAVAFFSVFGDLFESYLKRLANLKDSGDLFPGHGGVLDRVDALIFGAVVMVYFI